jgi:hypothetical protein
MGDSMHETNDVQRSAFEVLAKTYPHDEGVRMTADLARWLVQERQRQQLPAQQKDMRTVTQESHFSAAGLFRRNPLTIE